MQDNDNIQPKVTRKPLKLIYFKLHRIKPYHYSRFFILSPGKNLNYLTIGFTIISKFRP